MSNNIDIKDWADYDAWIVQVELNNAELLAKREENQSKMELVLRTVDELKDSGKTDEEVLAEIGRLIDED